MRRPAATRKISPFRRNCIKLSPPSTAIRIMLPLRPGWCWASEISAPQPPGACQAGRAISISGLWVRRWSFRGRTSFRPLFFRPPLTSPHPHPIWPASGNRWR